MHLQIVFAQPPNNTIFFGGSNDGISSTKLIQSSINLYTGGEEDGISSTQLIQPSTNLYTGGEGDGIGGFTYIQPSTNLYTGGEGDGISSLTYNQPSENLYTGGEGDGYSALAYTPNIDYALFYGGNGDGWAKIILPAIPLPIELLSFEGKINNTFHDLFWTTSTEKNSNNIFCRNIVLMLLILNQIGNIKAVGQSNLPTNYTFTNKNPIDGNNFYRLQLVNNDGSYKYSNIILLKQITDNINIAIYPNPTASILNLQLNGIPFNEHLEYKIIDFTGKTIESNIIKNNNINTLNISNYVTGTYSILINYKNKLTVIKFNKI